MSALLRIVCCLLAIPLAAASFLCALVGMLLGAAADALIDDEGE